MRILSPSTLCCDNDDVGETESWVTGLLRCREGLTEYGVLGSH